MSDEEKYEWRVTYDTRLGILCEDRQSTPEQRELARAEADAAVKAMREPELL